MANMTEVAQNFVIVARLLASNGSHDKAFDMYMCAFNKQPLIKEKIVDEFRTVLLKMSKELEDADNKMAIFVIYERVMHIFSDNVELLSDMGRHLYRYGYICEALCHFEKALNIDNNSINIEKILNNAKTYLFPRSKFRMLNDKHRNDAYRRALKDIINPYSDSVLNLDSCTGLLALYASECKPLAITACESSISMVRLTQCVIKENNAKEVVILNQPSIMLNRADMYGARTLVLTELIDNGLFNGYLLQSLCHAWQNLLTNNCKVIPGKADYYVVGINCRALHNKFKLAYEIKHLLNICNLNVHLTTSSSETYYSEDVHMYDVKYVTKPQHLFSIDFNNYKDLQLKLCRQEPYYANLTAIEDSEVSLIVGWFDLHLTDHITITNNPTSELKVTAWQQAVFYDFISKDLRKDETIQVPFVTSNGRTALSLSDNDSISRLSPEALAFLNDVEYTNMIKKSIGTVCIQLGQFISISDVDIVDLNPFPLFGIIMLKRGINSLTCRAKNIQEETFLKIVLKANGVLNQKVTILIADFWTSETFRNRTFHVIFSNIIDLKGDIDVRMLRMTQHLKESHLAPNGLCLPASVSVMGQLIYSHWLEINNRVLDENVGCKMAKHVNRYQVSQAMHVDTARLEYNTLSEVFSMKYGNGMKPDVIKVTVKEDGDCNAILCWYKVQLLEGWHALYTDRENSFVNSMAFITDPKTKIFKGDEVDVITCFDIDGSFKFILDVEPN